MSTDKVAALGRTPLFKELDAGLLRALAERAVERRFRKGELLFVAGEEARGLYVIVEGSVRAFRKSADGRESECVTQHLPNQEVARSARCAYPA